MINKNAKASGGIDLGGTKIEASLFDPQLKVITVRRRPTPTTNYQELCDALEAEIRWLRQKANKTDLPVGIGLPGLVDPETGMSVTANLPANGHALSLELKARMGGEIVIANDCKCFALSEANGGAGMGYSRVFGLVIGTGLGGGFCRDGALDLGANGLVGEVGHFGIPAHLAAQLKLPILQCGCGRKGCYETLVSGKGLSELAKLVTGAPCSGEVITKRAAEGDDDMQRVLHIWLRLTAELLHTIQLHLDPQCIVLGGGLSNIPDVDSLLETALADVALPTVRIPRILKPVFGDSSGGRGAALLTQNIRERKPNDD